MDSAECGGDGGPRKTMTPWEQHSAVISIPRFDYSAPASLLQHSHSGFLITCTIKREKSATKEAMAILEKYCRTTNNAETSLLESQICDEIGIAKRRKISSQELDVEGINCGGSDCSTKKSKDEDGNSPKDACPPTKETEPDSARTSLLSLVKLTRSGLVLFTFPKGHSADTVLILSEIIQSLKSGSLNPPQWCHRIFPIQATCCLNEQALQTAVENLVHKFMKEKRDSTSIPIKFAVGYNRRGVEETELKASKETSQSFDSDRFPLLDRNKCFEVVAAAVKGVIPDSVVDLKTPEVKDFKEAPLERFCLHVPWFPSHIADLTIKLQFGVLIELLPLSTVPSGSLVVAVSVLPDTFITTKPRLCVRALAPDTKTRNGKT